MHVWPKWVNQEIYQHWRMDDALINLPPTPMELGSTNYQAGRQVDASSSASGLTEPVRTERDWNLFENLWKGRSLSLLWYRRAWRFGGESPWHPGECVSLCKLTEDIIAGISPIPKIPPLPLDSLLYLPILFKILSILGIIKCYHILMAESEFIHVVSLPKVVSQRLVVGEGFSVR